MIGVLCLDETLFKILKKVYGKKRYIKNENGYQVPIETGDKYDCGTGTTQYSTENLTQAELSYLQESGYPLNEVVHVTHDETIKKLKEILKHPNISFKNLTAAYIAGFCSFPRGRQPIISYLFAAAVPVHSFVKWGNSSACGMCAIDKESWLETGTEIFREYLGYSWNEIPKRFYLDLEEFSQLPPKVPTSEDLHIFCAVIDLIRNAPADETVGKLEQRITKAKLIPKCEKYRLRGQLMALAELGVMPNRFIKPLYDEFTDFETVCTLDRKIPGSPRSDVVLPLSGWRGELGICEERYNEVFGEYRAI